MSDQDPVRWRDAPAHAPPGALELVRSIEVPPPLPPDLSSRVIARARPRPRRRWIGPSLAAAVILGGIVLWRFVPREHEHAVLAPADDRAGVGEPVVAPSPSEGAPAEPLREEPLATQVAMGALTVRSSPWARVFVDGRDTGRDTPLVEHALSAGPHDVELRTRAGTAFRATVEIRASETTLLAHHFEATASTRRHPEEGMPVPARADGRITSPFEERNPRPADARADDAPYGTLMIQSMPWARVLVDGRDTGRNTPVRNLRVTPGRHTIGLRTNDGVVHTVSVVVEAGQTTRIVRQL